MLLTPALTRTPFIHAVLSHDTCRSWSVVAGSRLMSLALSSQMSKPLAPPHDSVSSSMWRTVHATDHGPRRQSVTRVDVHSGIALLLSSTPGCRGSMAPDSLTSSRSEEHTSELQSLMRTSYAVVCL